jgi:hypothetical protein
MEMNFEEKSKLYINELVNDNVIIDAYLIGVNEDHKTSNGVARILMETFVEEKNIIIYERNNVMNWNYLSVINQNEI